MRSEVSDSPLTHEKFFNELIQQEYSRLIDQQHVYLDYTGGNLYAQSQLDRHFKLLSSGIFGNPHSTNPSSALSTRLVEEARQRVIDFFRADDYFCVFTANASGALKIVGESYPFDKNGFFLLLSDNHNSVNGIREYCRSKGAEFRYSAIRYSDLCIDEEQLLSDLKSHDKSKNKLFAFPAQSNVTGVKHDLEWVNTAHQQGWDVLLDAAAFVPTSRLDLRMVQPDFVSVSFYKIFGHPTGIGCLLIKKSSFEKLEKPWFAGGTVTLASVRGSEHFLSPNHERFEDGTLNYLDIPAVKIGLDHIDTVGLERLSERILSLNKYLYTALTEIRHQNGNPVVRVFGPVDRDCTGGTMIMNFFDVNDELYPFEMIEDLANARKISIRSGCFCNPGIDEINNRIDEEEIRLYFSTHKQGDYRDMVNFLHKMRGATRVSVGIATTKTDVDAYIAFVESLRNKKLGVLKSEPRRKAGCGS